MDDPELIGLLRNSARILTEGQADVGRAYAAHLNQVADHLADIKAGKQSLATFADLYQIKAGPRGN